MFANSIRFRLQLWLGFLLVAVLCGFGVTVYQLQRIHLLGQIDEDLERRVAILSSAVRGGPPPEPGQKRTDFEKTGKRPPPPPDAGAKTTRTGPREIRLSPESESLFDEGRAGAHYYMVWYRDGALLKHSTNAPAELARPERADRDTRRHSRMRGEFREAWHFTELGDCVLAGRSIAAHEAAMARFSLWLLAAGGTVLALGLGGGWWLTTRAIGPVEEISAAASRISAGNLSERIHTADSKNELGRLAGVLNSTFARLEAAFAQQKQFTADASHELRTPLAVMISEAQTTLTRERTAAEYRETVEACLDTAQQMRRLTESLLELSRFDAGQEDIRRKPVDLAEIARTCVEHIRPLAGPRGLKIHCALAPTAALGGAERLAQVITNLLTNAIHYNKEGGEIQVATSVENGSAVLKITDTGRGIAPEDLPNIFKRFFRADSSRSRANGHAGLGLAICKAIVDAHGGTIGATSTVGEGTTVTVQLPGSRDGAHASGV
ncbi:MAG: HAMP domain-containing protein [Verrucomicrobia bacterium]|nr:HAMP domain-containing protein [Verrucomicrobiota bacterium]